MPKEMFLINLQARMLSLNLITKKLPESLSNNGILANGLENLELRKKYLTCLSQVLYFLFTKCIMEILLKPFMKKVHIVVIKVLTENYLCKLKI